MIKLSTFQYYGKENSKYNIDTELEIMDHTICLQKELVKVKIILKIFEKIL